jgi:protein-S-isoprenylcysteine O-methyltransferase Ste14
MTLELKVPPLVVGLVMAGIMWLSDWVLPGWHIELPARRLVAGCVAVAGTLMLLAGVVSFRRAKTTVNPMKPSSSSSLVMTGIYAWTRNPMYVGFFLFMLAWGIVLSNAAAFVILPLFVLYMNRFQIGPEERALAAIFGDQYARYVGRVRRWL